MFVCACTLSIKGQLVSKYFSERQISRYDQCDNVNDILPFKGLSPKISLTDREGNDTSQLYSKFFCMICSLYLNK